MPYASAELETGCANRDHHQKAAGSKILRYIDNPPRVANLRTVFGTTVWHRRGGKLRYFIAKIGHSTLSARRH
jgi:hypothetical protein